MSKRIDVLAQEKLKQINYGGWDSGVMIEMYKAGYKQRSDELIDLLVELEEYFEKRQDADWEGEETGMVPNREMQFYSRIKDALEND